MQCWSRRGRLVLTTWQLRNTDDVKVNNGEIQTKDRMNSREERMNYLRSGPPWNIHVDSSRAS